MVGTEVDKVSRGTAEDWSFSLILSLHVPQAHVFL